MDKGLILTSLLPSSPSNVKSLTLSVVSKSNRELLAPILKSNKSITDLHVHFDSNSWTADRDAVCEKIRNCTLDQSMYIYLSQAPKESLAHTLQVRDGVVRSLEQARQVSMRSILSCRPEKIPVLFETDGSAERGRFGLYLCPLFSRKPFHMDKSYLESKLLHMLVTNLYLS